MFRVIPVIDLMNGVVVRGVRGERDRYEPIKSVLVRDSNPITVAKVFKERFGFKELYLADLDSIMSGNINVGIYRELIKWTGLKLMVDAGISTVNQCIELIKAGINKIIVATETLESIDSLNEIFKVIGFEKLILSIDLMGGRVISKVSEWSGAKPEELVEEVNKLNPSEVILLELSRVGSYRGVDEGLVKRIVNKLKVPLITGGGVRDVNDVVKLKSMGVRGVLIASALHDGRIKPSELKCILNE